MSNYNNLKSSINNNIYENQTQQITGTVLNAILNEMTNALGAGYQFAGVATVGMTPSEPDARIFYLAGEGIYTSFDGIIVPQGKLGILKWDNRWHLETIDGLGSGGANLTGYVTVASTDDLPDEGVATLGYLCGTNLYLYVGEGGDTKEGKYQNCGSFRGPQGDSVQDVEQTQTSLENGGVNKIKFTLSNGISCEFQVRNGTTSSGLFPTLSALQTAYPSPVVGQYAFVGSGFPADIYICTTAGTWTDSGEDYDGDNVDLTDYALKSEVNELELKVNGNLMSKRAKNALLSVFEKVAFAVPDVSSEMTELENALFNLDEVTGVNAVYTQGNVVIWSDGVSSLNDLKANLVVKAEYGDGTETEVNNYTLSGSLTTGTSVITVTYQGFTTAFSVTVTEYGSKMSYTMAEGSILNDKGRLDAYAFGNTNYMQAIKNFELSTETTRRVFVTNFGINKLRNENDVIINAYPIKIPKTATKAVVTVSGNNQQIAGRVIYLLNDGRYKVRGDQDSPADPNLPYINVGFVTGTNTINFSEVVNRDDTYLLIHGRRVSDASYTNNEPTAITVTFSNQ